MRLVWATLAVLALTVSIALSVVRNLVLSDRLLAIASSLASYALLGYGFALVVFLLLLVRPGSRRRLAAAGAAVAVVGVALQAVWLAPLFAGGGAGTRSDLVVMNSNLEFGEGDPHAVVAAVRSHHVDVLVLEEVTPDAVEGLASSGLTRLLPQVAGSPDDDAAGTMVYSRYRLGEPERLAVSHGGLAVTVSAPAPFRLLAVHPSQPVLAASTWVSDLDEVRARARLAVRRGPTMVVGDLNSGWDNRLFRNLFTAGLRDAGEESNAGWQPTWPSMMVVPVPRLVTLDHVLTSDRYAAVSTATLPVPGSDHRALVARLEVR